MNEDNQDILLEPLFTGQVINVGEYPESRNQHVRELAQKCSGVDRQLFCEMLELCGSPDDCCWFEQARWIKYEETVEGTKERWSKPHVSMLTMKALLQLRNCFSRGLVLLDVDVNSFGQCVDHILKGWEEEKMIHTESAKAVKTLLMCNKEHVSNKRYLMRLKLHGFSPNVHRGSIDVDRDKSLQSTIDSDRQSNNGIVDDEHVDEKEKGKNVELSKKLPETAEVACILVGCTECVSSTVSAFVRLSEPRSMPNCSEVNRKVRFIFVLLAPEDVDSETNMVGKTMGVALTDEVFVHCAYEAQNAADLYCAVDEMISSAMVIAPGKWSVDKRLEPDNSQKIITRRSIPWDSDCHAQKAGFRKSIHEFHADGLQYTGRIFGGLREDIARKLPYWISDFVSPFSSPHAFSQCLAASLYLFFANFTNIITFGGIMGKMLDQQIAVIECVISGCISGLIFGTFSGQPLNIMSATGPVLIFESIFYHFCESHNWPFLPARFWLGFWTAIILLLLVAFDASFLVAYITRFTEESFATLISVIFIFESFQAMFKLASNTPITTDLTQVLSDPCRCVANMSNTAVFEEGLSFHSIVGITNSSLAEINTTDFNECKKFNGSLVGNMCKFQPDVYVFSILLFLCTFIMAYTFHMFRKSRFFPSKVRSIVGDFNVFITIVIMTVCSYFVGLPVETLITPTSFKPSVNRSWLVDVTDLYDWWIVLACILPGVFLTVLIVMDQQITAVIVNRKDNKMKKGFGYHLDLAMVAVLVMVCSVFGLPFFVAATILSITHVQSLRIESECSAPGEKPRFLGVREQRVTVLFAHSLVGLSVFLASVQKHIPIAVLLGIFLYMGVTSMLTQQFVERILLFFTPVKHQPDYFFLRIVPLKRVFLFTAIQLGAFMLLCAVKYSKNISMLFPILLVVLVGVRKGLDAIFSPKEMMALDDVLPNFQTLVKRRPSSIRVSTNGSSSKTTAKLLPNISNCDKREDHLL